MAFIPSSVLPSAMAPLGAASFDAERTCGPKLRLVLVGPSALERHGLSTLARFRIHGPAQVLGLHVGTPHDFLVEQVRTDGQAELHDAIPAFLAKGFPAGTIFVREELTAEVRRVALSNPRRVVARRASRGRGRLRLIFQEPLPRLALRLHTFT